MEEKTKVDYYDVDAISNSAMSKINPAQGGSLRKFRLWQEAKKEGNEQKYFERGRLLHTAILEPNLYKVEDIEKPSDNICSIIEMVYAEFTDHSILPSEIDLETKALYQPVFDTVKEAAKILGYGQKWKDDTVYAKVRDEGSEYLQFLMSASDKLVISKADKEIIDASFIALQKHPDAQRMLFQEECDKEYEIHEVLDDVRMKSKLDIHKVEDNVITIRELKSTSMPVTLFPYSFTKFRYYRQSAVYGRMAAAEYFRQHNFAPSRIIHEYVVVEMTPPHEVMVYIIHPDWITYGKAEMKNILDYYKAGIDIFPSTALTMKEEVYPRGHSELLNVR